jgi:hypothetical protein
VHPEGGRIVVGEGVLSLRLDIPLLKHEFGHILQAREVGLSNYYYTIAEESFLSASRNSVVNHSKFWTETWANYKSFNYFNDNYGVTSWPTASFPIQNLSRELYIQKFGVNLYFQNL